MLVAAIVAYRLEGNPLEWSALMARFNYRPLSLRDLLIIAGIFAVEMALYLLMTRVSGWLIGQGIITLPANLPAFVNPQTVWTQETINAATGGLRGNWFLFFFSLALLAINVIGEEFWWRGLILPRQQLAFAGWTLLVHALLWTLFHGFKYWDLLNLLPLSLGLTFAVLYLNNSSAGLLMHFISNGVGLIPILLVLTDFVESKKRGMIETKKATKPIVSRSCLNESVAKKSVERQQPTAESSFLWTRTSICPW